MDVVVGWLKSKTYPMYIMLLIIEKLSIEMLFSFVSDWILMPHLTFNPMHNPTIIIFLLGRSMFFICQIHLICTIVLPNIGNSV
jgi:hypothetical protein